MPAYDIAIIFTEVAAIKKEICYLLGSAGAGSEKWEESEKKKKYLTGQGKLVVTVYEGEEDMEKGLREIVRNRL